MMQLNKKMVMLFAVVAVWSLLAGLSIYSLTVNAMERSRASMQAAYCSQIEELYKQNLRDYLSGQGYGHAGLTMTHSTNEWGECTIYVQVNHRNFDRCSAAELHDMEENMSKMGPDRETFGYCVSIL